MKENRYILTVQNRDIFKEVAITNKTTTIKIGTQQDCDIRLKKELFEEPVSVTLHNKDGNVSLLCDSGLYLVTETEKARAEMVINIGDILKLSHYDHEDAMLTFMLNYDLSQSESDFDTIVDIRNLSELIIGNVSNAHLKLQSKFILSEHITLSKSPEGKLILDSSHALLSATLNGNRVFESIEVKEYDFIGIADYSFYYKNQMLYTAERKDMIMNGVSHQALREETPAFNYPLLNRSPRMMHQFDNDDIDMLNPPEKPKKPKGNLAMQLMPALAMIGVTVLTRSGIIGGLRVGNPAFLIFSLSMMAVGIMTSIMTFVQNKKNYKQDLEDWNKDYTNYVARKRKEIEFEREAELRALIDVYPSSGSIRNFVKTFSGRLFERSPEEHDFLHVRVGLGRVPAKRQVAYSRTEQIKVDNELMEIPEQICNEYEEIDQAPVMIHLRESGNIGVVGNPDEQFEFFKTMLLDFSVLHDYEDVKTIVLIPPEKLSQYEWIKWLPHIDGAGGSMRGVVTDAESRDHVFEYLYSIAALREAQTKDDEAESPLPHYTVFVLDEYGIKTHPLFNYVENAHRLGISFVYFKEYKENLPKYCEEIVELSPGTGRVKLKKDKQFIRAFTREQINNESIKFVCDRLAPVYCEKIALSSRLTSSITLFELLNIISPDNLNLKDRWSKSEVHKSMAAPLGVDAKGSIIDLDLHEKAHGPHGLVAGTTGSGKSEIMQSYILSTAVNFHPYEVSFVIIDFKGGGMANQFEKLPHLIGKITDIDGHEINRSLLSIRAELEKRKRIFAEYNVNQIDHYIAKYKDGEASVPLPHLVMIVDEFAELKADQPEFMKELISTARVGRSLGIHLILATQKPAGQVNEQIWSNSRFKLCLKVATKQDSKEVLKSPLASEIREPGRAYMQVGNNEIFTLFQSAYSGASALSDKYGSTREFHINEVDFTGKKTTVYERKAKCTNDGEKLTQLQALVDYVGQHCENSLIERLPSICLPPLPEVIEYSPSLVDKPDSSKLSIGIYDDPNNQVQPNLELNLFEGNVMIIGASQTGKTMLLQSMIKSLANQHSPKDVSIYILDFASKVLKMFDGLNHVGGVVTDSDDEKLKNFFKLINEELSYRKEYFSNHGYSSYEAYLEMNQSDSDKLPHIVIMIDNLVMFREIFQAYEGEMLNLCREGLALGITIIATAKQTVGLSYKFISNFATRLTFSCTESGEYNTVFDRCLIRPKNVQGRGLASIDKIVYEYQAYLPFGGETEGQRIKQIKDFISETSKSWGSVSAKRIPGIPKTLTEEYWSQNNIQFGSYQIPIGLSYSSIDPVIVDLLKVGTIGIYGREGFGKSNLIRSILNHLQKHVFDQPCEAYIIDGYDRQLSEFSTYGFVEQMTIDCSDFEEILHTFIDEAEHRMDMLRDGLTLEEEPLMLCVIENSKIYAMNTISRDITDKFKKLLKDLKQLKMCFIFSNIDNNPEFSASEMMKCARDLGQYYLLDDIANVKLFGSSKFTINDLKPYKKPVIVSEGYSYDSRSGLDKVKFVKCERSS